MKKYFQNCRSLDELKKEYRRLVMLHHPDRGGDTATMQAINAEYEQMHELLKNSWNASHDAEHQCTEAPEEFRDIIESLLKMDGVTSELCGQWIWISGNTYAHKDELKALGCRWSSNKKMWYWRHESESHKYHKSKKTMDEIRVKYGSQIFRGVNDGFAKLGAAC